MFNNHYEWAIIGAGPAGITAVGNLIDSGVDPKTIAWVDPNFAVGDFGSLWTQVSSNTSVQLFHNFFNACASFDFNKAPAFAINDLNPKGTCLLEYAAEPLRWITEQLLKKVSPQKNLVTKITMSDGCWKLQMNPEASIFSKNVILAIGSTPQSLAMEGVTEIPLTTALDKNKLKEAIQGKKKIAVFGSSHSAIILIRELLENGVPEVINFYREPLRYAVFFEDWTLFDNTGLKGKTAAWAKANLHGNTPKGLKRYISTPENVKQHFTSADAVIYATGFKRRKIEIDGLNNDFDYNAHCGVIAPGLFGIGIAFPEKTIDRYGNQELSVGLWKFMKYVKKTMPLWLVYSVV